MIRILRFLALLCIASIFGLSFAHVAELPGKLRLPGPLWLAVQHNLYVGFGAFAEVVEPLAIVLTWVLAVLLRHRRANRLTLAAAILTTVGLIEWALVVAPMNTRLNAWTAAALPATWIAVRNRWELGHIIHAALFGLAFCLLLFSILAETAPIRHSGRSEAESRNP